MGSLAIELVVAILIGLGLDRLTRPSALDRFWQSWLERDGIVRAGALTALGGTAGFLAVAFGRAGDVRPLADHAMASGAILGSGGAVVAIVATIVGVTRATRLVRFCHVLSLGRCWVISKLDERAAWKIHTWVRCLTPQQLAAAIKDLKAIARSRLDEEDVDPYRRRINAAGDAMRSPVADVRHEGWGEFQAVCADLILRLRVTRESLATHGPPVASAA